MEILGYFVDVDADMSASTVFVALKYDDGTYGCYCPIGQHGKTDAGYINDCRKITKAEYIEYAGALYTPADYLR